MRTCAHAQAVLVRYEDDAHFPVDKVVGAGAQDNAPSSVGCKGTACPKGDSYDALHHKERCPPGSVVTGAISRSGERSARASEALPPPPPPSPPPSHHARLASPLPRPVAARRGHPAWDSSA